MKISYYLSGGGHGYKLAAYPNLAKKLVVGAVLLGLGLSSTVNAKSFSENVTGDPSVVVGSEDSPESYGIQGSTNVTIDTQEGGDIDVYAATGAIAITSSKASLTVGSNRTDSLNLSTKYVDGTTNKFASQLTGVNFSGVELTLNAAEINIDVDAISETKELKAYGLSLGSTTSSNNIAVNIGSEITQTLNISATGTDARGISAASSSDPSGTTTTSIQAQNINVTSIGTNDSKGLYSNSAQTSLSGDIISIISSGTDSRGIHSLSGSITTLSAADTITISSSGSKTSATVYAIESTNSFTADTINIFNDGVSDGFAVYSSKADTTLKGDNINITSSGHGVFVNNVDKSDVDSTARMIIDGKNTVINAQGSGLLAFSYGYLEVKGNLTVNALNAIDARGNATININQDKDSTVILNGNITFEESVKLLV